MALNLFVVMTLTSYGFCFLTEDDDMDGGVCLDDNVGLLFSWSKLAMTGGCT